MLYVLGEEQEFDLSPLKQCLPEGATTIPSGCCVERKLAYSPSSPPSLSPRGRARTPTPTSMRQESSDGELSSGISTISDINREPLSIDTERENIQNVHIYTWIQSFNSIHTHSAHPCCRMLHKRWDVLTKSEHKWSQKTHLKWMSLKTHLNTRWKQGLFAEDSPSPLKFVDVPLSPDSSPAWVSNTVAYG